MHTDDIDTTAKIARFLENLGKIAWLGILILFRNFARLIWSCQTEDYKTTEDQKQNKSQYKLRRIQSWVHHLGRVFIERHSYGIVNGIFRALEKPFLE
jgi:hypothetical protein